MAHFLHIKRDKLGHLFACNGRVRLKGRGACAVDDAVAEGPGNVGRVIHIRRYVSEKLRRAAAIPKLQVHALHASQDRHEHTAGHGALRFKGGAADTVEQLQLDGTFYVVPGPVVIGVGKGPYSRDGRQQHQHRKQRRNQPVFHENHPFAEYYVYQHHIPFLRKMQAEKSSTEKREKDEKILIKKKKYA